MCKGMASKLTQLITRRALANFEKTNMQDTVDLLRNSIPQSLTILVDHLLQACGETVTQPIYIVRRIDVSCAFLEKLP